MVKFLRRKNNEILIDFARSISWKLLKKDITFVRTVTVMASLSAYSVTEPLGLTLGVNAH